MYYAVRDGRPTDQRIQHITKEYACFKNSYTEAQQCIRNNGILL
ncbi:hypothetical protein SAMN05216436_106106 [bacterium A37T11]|nr:hypothetical protein SAMN05216436_106106 [bacterium A37T11]